MKKIYKDFDHLMKENEKLFDVLKKEGVMGFIGRFGKREMQK